MSRTIVTSPSYAALAFDTLIAALYERDPAPVVSLLKDQLRSADSSSRSKPPQELTKFSLADYKRATGNGTPSAPEPDTPLFVTWNIRHNDKATLHTSQEDSKELRGCIGNFSSLPLETGIREYALIAAFEDPRFPPITSSELARLECSITLLKDFELIDNPLNWEIGKHGLRISIQSPFSSRRLSSTFLPDVAPEQGWTKDDTLEHLLLKAGVPAGSGSWEDFHNSNKLQVTRYKGVKSKITLSDYLTLRSQLEDSPSSA
ncbi:BA75_00055T0 [Komagataella pastoris]|uniref:BA75_00055T0 n=1 Tax=Komagataella pastoris TaxID=4922 RepID=A0A1B2J9H9_PICPA|nr:BA75_00055T0 [Komagataella pastoris]